MLISIPPKYAVSQVVGFMKGKSAIHIAREFFGRRKNFTAEEFWATGYHVSTVGKNEEAIRKYIKEQEREDRGQAPAGVQNFLKSLDSRFHGNDRKGHFGLFTKPSSLIWLSSERLPFLSMAMRGRLLTWIFSSAQNWKRAAASNLVSTMRVTPPIRVDVRSNRTGG